MAKDKFVLIGSGASARPLPRKMGPVFEELSKKSGATLSSGLRTSKAVAYARALGAILNSQPELYQMFLNGTGAPANKPGGSTHERRSDGVAYALPYGSPLFWWQVGMDIGAISGATFCDAARADGWIATVTYSTESWHVNFRKEPIMKHIFRAAKKGQKRVLVLKISRKLKLLGFAPSKNWTPRRKFDQALEDMVVAFQKKHHLKPDGVVGIHTWRQLQVTARKHRKDHK